MKRQTPAAAAIAAERLARQELLGPRFRTPAELVRWMGAVQAQDYPGGLWAMGLRLAEATEASVEAAVAARTIVRTWPMRRTLHFVPAEDARWMVALLASRLVAGAAGRYRALGIEPAAFRRSRQVLIRALEGGRRLTRPDAYAVLARGGVPADGQRGIHILAHLAQEGLLCFGPREGRQPTFVLLEEWIPAGKSPARDEALATLATRYFTSHGPATVHDFAWWSSLTLKDARAAIDRAGGALRAGEVGRITASRQRTPRVSTPSAQLLPPWDEYLVAYRDRSAVVDEQRLREPLGVIGRPLVVIEGRVRGAWRRTLTETAVRVELELWTKLASAERQVLEAAVKRYGRFLQREVHIAGSGY